MRRILYLIIILVSVSCDTEKDPNTILNVHVKEMSENKNLEGETVTLYYDGFSSRYAINETKELGPDNRASFEFLADESGGYWIKFDECCRSWTGGPEVQREENVKSGVQNDIELAVYASGYLFYTLENWDHIDGSHESDYCHLTVSHALYTSMVDHEGRGNSPISNFEEWSGWYDFDWYVVINGDTTYHHDSKYLEQGGNLEFIVKY